MEQSNCLSVVMGFISLEQNFVKNVFQELI